MLTFLSNEAKRLSYPNPEQLQTIFQKYTQVYRTSESLDFLQSCIYRKVVPFFAKVTSNDVKRLGINIQEQPVLETRKLETERNAKSRYLAILENEFELLPQKIKLNCKTPIVHFKLLHFIKNTVKKFELKSNERRHRKFYKLTNTDYFPYNKAKVYNRTDIVIPDPVLEILELIKNRGVGAPFSLTFA